MCICMQVPTEARSTGCELPNVSVENQTQVLCKSSKCS